MTQDASTNPANTYQWDAEGRLSAILHSGTTFETLTYNARGQVVEGAYPGYNDKVEGVFDPSGKELGYYNGVGGAWWDRDIWGAGRMVAQSYSADTYFLHANLLHSDTQITDYSGAVQTDFIYYPWQIWTEAGNMVDAHFAGFQQSGGPNYGTPFRQYSGGISRWLSPDPNNAGADPANPQSWNAYSYAGNNPTTFTDPSGLKCIQLDDGAFADDMTGGGCDKAGVTPNGEVNPEEIQVNGRRGNWATAVGVNAFLELANTANDYFVSLIGMRPSFMQNTPTGSGIAANVGAAVGLVGTALIGPEGGAEDSIGIAEGRLTKVLEAHTAGGLLSTGKSLFDNPDEVRDLIQAAKSAPAVAQSGRFAGKFERVVDAGRIIGTDRTGSRTSIYTVITDSNLHLVTAFPGRP